VRVRTRDIFFELCRRDCGSTAVIDPEIGSLDALVIYIKISDMTRICRAMLTKIYTAFFVKYNNWPSSFHCKELIAGYEAAAGMLEAV